MATVVSSVALTRLLDSLNIYTACIFVVVTATILYLFWSPGKKTPPGPTPWPILGSYPQIAKAGHGKFHVFFHQLYKRYGAVAQIYFGSYPVVVVSGYEDVRDVFIKQSDVIAGRPDFLPGLIFSNGTHWLEARRTMLTAVGLVEKRYQFEEMVLEEVQQLIQGLSKNGDAPFQPYEQLRLASVSLHLCGILGKRYDRLDAVYERFLKSFRDVNDNDTSFSPMGTVPLLRYVPVINKSFRTYQCGYEGLDQAVMTELQERQSSFDADRLESVLDVFIRERRKCPHHKTYSDDSIAAVVGDYLIGGGSSVVNTLDWALLHLVACPQVQKKCQKEIDTVCGTKDPVKFSHIDKLPFVTATVYEAQRMGSVVPVGVPHCCLKDMKIKGYSVPQGTIILSNLTSVMMDDSQWNDPKLFNPDRFLDENGKLTMKPPAFMPFGTGARMCPGYSVSEKTVILVLANLLQSLEFTSSGKVNLEGKHGAGLFPESNEIIAKKRM